MAKTALPSRLNPLYLASKYAGSCFFLAALGLAAGMAWRCLFLPTRYGSQAQTTFAVSPAEQADMFDWDGKVKRWRGILSNPVDQGLLTANLRHVVKLAATQGANLETERLAMELALFDPARRYSTLLLDTRLPAWLSPSIEVKRGDIAANMDPQSLAAVASDLNPPQGATGWDFSFFDAGYGGGVESYIITNPGPEDRHFRVFYQLHELITGRRAASPDEAWQTAMREISERLEREAEFAGGGGFGHLARRELMREITAIPALTANRLYHASLWSGDPDYDRAFIMRRWTENFALAADRRDRTTGVLTAGMAIDLHPLAFPRDTVLTRLAPLATTTLLAYISVMEKNSPPETVTLAEIPAVPAPTPPMAPPRPPEPATAIVRVAPAEPIRVVDREAEARRKDRILVLEEQLRRARLDRDSALRRLEAARETERNLTLEALAARDRADRLGERYHEASAGAEGAETEQITLEAARLLLARDAVMERLANLLQTCTEEHPFVRQARRELTAIDALLANIDTTENAARTAEARNARLSQLRIDWDRAKSAAATLDARRRQLFEASEAALAAVTEAESSIASTEAELGRVRDEPLPMITQAPPTAKPDPSPAPEPEPVPEPEIPAPVVPAETSRTATAPIAAFSATPASISTTRMAPAWDMPILGALLGLCLGVLRMLSRELAAGRFANAYQARHMVKLPLLLALPLYDAKSFRNAADTMRGEVFGTRRGKMTFIPLPVEFTEPKPEARRNRVRPARRLPRIGTWIAGLLMLALAGAVFSFSLRGFAQPTVAFRGEMSVPAAEDFNLSESANADEWGTLP